VRSPGPKPILEYGCRKVPVGWQKLSNYAIIWGIHPADLIPDWSAVRSRQRARGERFDMESAGVPGRRNFEPFSWWIGRVGRGVARYAVLAL